MHYGASPAIFVGLWLLAIPVYAANSPSALRYGNDIAQLSAVAAPLGRTGRLIMNPAVTAGRCVEGRCFRGLGTYQFANGDIYRGEFAGGDMQGHGEYHYSNGTLYQGEFRNNRPNGQGEFRYPDGGHYVGEVRDSRLYGVGTLYLPNGQTITGGWGDSD